MDKGTIQSYDNIVPFKTNFATSNSNGLPYNPYFSALNPYYIALNLYYIALNPNPMPIAHSNANFCLLIDSYSPAPSNINPNIVVPLIILGVMECY